MWQIVLKNNELQKNKSDNWKICGNFQSSKVRNFSLSMKLSAIRLENNPVNIYSKFSQNEIGLVVYEETGLKAHIFPTGLHPILSPPNQV